MRPYKEVGLGQSSPSSDRQHRLSFAGMWDDDEDLLDGFVYDQEDHQPVVAINDTDDDLDDEHDFVDMKRRSLLVKREKSKDQVVVDIEVDKIFDEVFTDRATATAQKPVRGSMISVAFTNDEVYDDDDDDYMDDDDSTMDFKTAKIGEKNLLHDSISNSVFYGFMTVSICLVIYMVFLMFAVEADEPNTVVTYVINHTKHEHSHPSHPDSPQMPLSNHKTWEHVFEDGDEDSSGVKGNRPDNYESTDVDPDDGISKEQGVGSGNQTVELGKAMHVAEQFFDSDQQKEGITDESHPDGKHAGRGNQTGALGKAMQVAEQTFKSNQQKEGGTEESHQDGKPTASGNQTSGLNKAMQIAEQTFDSNQPKGGSVEDSHRDDEPIGFMEAPPKLEELLLLIHTNTGREISSSSLDTTNHQERVNDDGSILHCGIKVEGNLVTVECLVGEELCGIYLGGYRCEPSDQA